MTKVAEGAIIFSEHAVFPQIPSIEAVRIALNDLVHVLPKDREEFAFCESNAMTFVDNARACAKILTSNFPKRTVFSELEIKTALMEMCLACARVLPEKRQKLRQDLWDLRGWDRHKVLSLMFASI